MSLASYDTSVLYDADGQSLAPEYVGWDKPPHSYARSPRAPHFSHQDYVFKKNVCMTDSRRKITDPASVVDGDGSYVASTDLATDCDNRREALLKKQMQNHMRQDEVTMKELIQPGDREDSECAWGTTRENRSNSVPHWSRRAFELKKKHHAIPVHKTPRNAANLDMVSSSQRAYQHPQKVRRQQADSDDGHPHTATSHAHLQLAMRRHNVYLKHDECDFRSTHPPQKSAESHFYASPEPHHMACYLYPEGPSITARHCPEHFVSNVVYESESRGARTPAGRNRRGTSVDSGYTGRSSRGSKGPKGIYILNGTKPVALTELALQNHEARAETKTTPTAVSGWTATTATSGKYYYPQESPFPQTYQDFEPPIAPTSPETHNFLASPGKPAPVDARMQENGHVYKSQAQLQYDKMLCQAQAYRHSTAKWERTAAGSRCSESESGQMSCVSASFADGRSSCVSASFADSQSRVRGRAEREGARTARRSSSVDGVQRRGRSADGAQTSRRQPQRAASNDRYARTPGRPVPRTPGSDYSRRSRRSAQWQI